MSTDDCDFNSAAGGDAIFDELEAAQYEETVGVTCEVADVQLDVSRAYDTSSGGSDTDTASDCEEQDR